LCRGLCGSLWGASGGIPAFAPGMASLEFDFLAAGGGGFELTASYIPKREEGRINIPSGHLTAWSNI